MMTSPILAITIDPDWLVYGVVAVVVVISWIYNAIKHLQQQPRTKRSMEHMLERRVRGLTDRSGKASGTGGGASGERGMDELAARRRRQLQELARRKQGKPSTSGSATSAQPRVGSTPTGASASRSQQLQRARQLAAQRAQSQARSRGVAQQARPTTRKPVSPATAKSQRPQVAKRPTGRTQPPQQRRSGVSRPQAVPQDQLRRQAKSDQPTATDHLERSDIIRVQHTAQRHEGTLTSTAMPARVVLTSGRSLRDAIVLKEILDPPMALREPGM